MTLLTYIVVLSTLRDNENLSDKKAGLATMRTRTGSNYHHHHNSKDIVHEIQPTHIYNRITMPVSLGCLKDIGTSPHGDPVRTEYKLRHP